MLTSTATKKQLLESIRAHCIECCGGSPKAVNECLTAKCNLFSFRMGYSTTSSDQTHLFRCNDRQKFFKKLSNTVDIFGFKQFGFSEIRKCSDYVPLCGSWWGGFASTMRKTHDVVTRQKSSTDTRNGAWENVWVRKMVSNQMMNEAA